MTPEERDRLAKVETTVSISLQNIEKNFEELRLEMKDLARTVTASIKEHTEADKSRHAEIEERVETLENAHAARKTAELTNRRWIATIISIAGLISGIIGAWLEKKLGG